VVVCSKFETGDKEELKKLKILMALLFPAVWQKMAVKGK
jgi:hypothetical protein